MRVCAGWPHFIGGVYEHNGSPTIEYQTGCPSSIPSYKSLIRTVGSAVRQADTLFALALLYDKMPSAQALALFQDLLYARRAMGIVQHHGAIASRHRVQHTP